MSYRLPLPPELEKKWGHLPDLDFKGYSRGEPEWSSQCPICFDNDHDPRSGKPDRFFMHGNDATGRGARGQCRRCGHFEWADQDKTDPPDPAKILEYEEIRRKEQRRERARLKAKIALLQDQAYYKGWHDNMTGEHRLLWEKTGIPSEFQDHWELGYMEAYKGSLSGKEFESKALTIPYFQPERRPFTIQYRLLQPPRPKDKYRFGKGFRTGLWLSDPDQIPEGACLLCEGVKKAAVAFIEIVAKMNRSDLTIVSAPSKKPRLDILNTLENCDPIWIAFDPDAYEPMRTQEGIKPPAIKEVYKYLQNGGHDVRLVKLPMKLDDMLLTDGIDGSYVTNAMRRARRLTV